MPSSILPTDRASVIAVLYDVGETDALKGVFKKLDKVDIDYYAIVMGTAAEKSNELGYNQDKILYLNRDFKRVVTNINAIDADRDKKLPEKDVEYVAKKVAKLKPFVIITGTVSFAQWQICESIAKKSEIKRENMFAYYDNLNILINDNPAKKTIDNFLESHYTMLVTSFFISESMPYEATVVGHSGVDDLSAKVAKVNAVDIRKKLNIPLSDPIITYIGGYGDGYKESFLKFVSAIKKIKQNPSWKSLRIIILIHPKHHNTPYEKLSEIKFVQDLQLRNLMIFKRELKIEEILAIANLCISQLSSIIPQAINAGIPSHYMNEKNIKNTMVENGLCFNLKDEGDILTVLLSKNNNDQSSFLERAGMPKNSTKKIFDIILDAIKL